MKTSRTLLNILFLIITLGIFACSEDDDNVVVSKNELVAVAGENQTVNINTEILLDGSESYDGNEKPFNYSWEVKTKPQGSVATIGSSNSVKATFKPDKAGTFIIQLVISQENWTAKDEVIINVNPANPNEPVAVVLNQDINFNTTLVDIFEDPSQPDYIVTENIHVRGDLTIMPGVVIAFEQHKGMEILSGAFVAKGNENKRIILKGLVDMQAYWKGIVVHSNNINNELDFVTIREAGSQLFQDQPVKAGIILAGSSYSGATLAMHHSSVEKGGGYGIYVNGVSVLTGFTNNRFSSNLHAAAFVPVSELHKLDASTEFISNGFNGVETSGTLQVEDEVQWKKLNNASYLVSGNLNIKSGLIIEQGASLKVKTGLMISVLEQGYLNATGTENEKIIFTSAISSEYWSGLYFDSPAEQNKLHYAEISKGGFAKIAQAQYESNIVIGFNGQLSVKNSQIKNGLGYGLVAKFNHQVNEDIVSSNNFENLPKGNVYPTVLQNPDMPELEGTWVDRWTFNQTFSEIASNFYNPQTETWFAGAANPWAMNNGKGFGIQITESGEFLWTIAEQSPWSGCESWSAEYITGSVSHNDQSLVFNQEYWRSKFINSCDATQNVDTEVTTFELELPYEIKKVNNLFTGEAYWELTLFNPDNTKFFYYRK